MDNKIEFFTDPCKNTYWFMGDDYHREDGPAIIWNNGDTEWFSHGKHHRLDGPAFEFINEPFNNEWWISGKCITQQIVPWAEENNIDLNNLSSSDKLLIKLVWADYGK